MRPGLLVVVLSAASKHGMSHNNWGEGFRVTLASHLRLSPPPWCQAKALWRVMSEEQREPYHSLAGKDKGRWAAGVGSGAYNVDRLQLLISSSCCNGSLCVSLSCERASLPTCPQVHPRAGGSQLQVRGREGGG